MRVLVTGGAGYIGSHAARALARRGHEVMLYDNLSTGHPRLAQGFPLVTGDTGDAARLVPLLAGMDAVMHFAALSQVGESVENPGKYFENNVRAGLALLGAVLQAKVRNFIFSSTAAVYGYPERIPIAEDAHALEAYSRAYGLRSMSLRYFNAAGAGDGGEIGEWHEPESHLIPLALQTAAGRRPQLDIYGEGYPTPDGSCIRDFIHVLDLAEAHVLALEHLADRGEDSSFAALNLGTGKGHSVKEVVAVVAQVTGRPLPVQVVGPRPGDPAVLVADPAAAGKLLQWKAGRDLRDMVQSAWQWEQRRSAEGLY
jgi:UDP-glucose-4-epimerase GalE